MFNRAEMGEKEILPDPDSGLLRSLEDFIAFAKDTKLAPREVYSDSLHRAERNLGEGLAIQEWAASQLPTIIVPDLHGRRLMIARLLATSGEKLGLTEDKSQTVFDLLSQSLVRIVFLGDYVHTEKKEDWPSVADCLAFDTTEEVSESMRDQLTLQALYSLGVVKMVTDLQHLQPHTVCTLRGNHDMHQTQILSELGVGSIRKSFTDRLYPISQGDLFIEWFRTGSNWGADFFPQYLGWEQKLPLILAATHDDAGELICSHAIPNERVRKHEIETRSPDALLNLLWTNNGEFNQHEIAGVLEENVLEIVPDAKASSFLWVIGHRSTGMNLMRTWADNRIVQINQPHAEVVGVVKVDQGRPLSISAHPLDLDMVL